MKKIIKIFAILALIALIIISISVFYAYRYISEYGHRQYTIEEPFRLNVERGDSAKNIIKRLYEQNITEDLRLAIIYYRLFFRDQTLKAGLYDIPEISTLHDILSVIISGDIAVQRITIIEGITIWDTRDIIMEYEIDNKQDFMRLCYDKEFLEDLGIPFKNIEGFLYPDTYILPIGIDIETFMRIMVKRAFDMYEKVYATATHPLNIKDAFLLASLIQTESHTKAEGPKIASVFLNRLKKGMLLQCDPTVIYALRRHDLYRGRLLRKDLRFDDPYNTYVYSGYTPTPIASPGYHALFASMNPADTDYLFFVAKDSTTHAFARTYREHRENIRRYRR